MGLIDGATRDECKTLEGLMQSFADNGQWYQAWAVHVQGAAFTLHPVVKIKFCRVIARARHSR